MSTARRLRGATPSHTRVLALCVLLTFGLFAGCSDGGAQDARAGADAAGDASVGDGGLAPGNNLADPGDTGSGGASDVGGATEVDAGPDTGSNGGDAGSDSGLRDGGNADPGDAGDEDAGDSRGSADTGRDAGAQAPEPWSCAPGLELDAERYQGVEAERDAALIEALFGMVEGHTSLTYRQARLAMFGEISVREDGLVECVYTGKTATPDGTTTPGTFDTEHSWPQSEGADLEPAKSDLHHLFPTDSFANTKRSSLEFGMTTCVANACTWHEGGSELGASPDGRETVFEVRPVHRGDIARAHFYFSVRYQMPIGQKEEAILRQWHCEDPPDAWERLRHERIVAYQSNRNPFVDRPDLVERIADF